MTVRFMSLVHSLSFYLSMKLEEVIGSMEAMLILFVHCIKCDSMSAEHNGFYVAKNDAELLSQSFLGHPVW